MGTLMVALAIAAAASVTSAQDSQQTLALQHLRAGQNALHVEHWEQAEREFKAAIELDPLLDLAHYGLGQVYMATKRYQEAVRAYARCREVFHSNESARMLNNLDAQRRLDDQIRELRDYRRSFDTGRTRTMNTSATINRLDGEIAQLEALRRRDHDAAPQTPPYISTALGGAYFRTGALADAEREWRLALAVDPTIGEVHNNLAVVCMLTERYDEAEKEVALAEKTGFKVSPSLKQDIKARKAGRIQTMKSLGNVCWFDTYLP
jgi:tetratricopeptide (TPR) repeat protein